MYIVKRAVLSIERRSMGVSLSVSMGVSVGMGMGMRISRTLLETRGGLTWGAHVGGSREERGSSSRS